MQVYYTVQSQIDRFFFFFLLLKEDSLIDQPGLFVIELKLSKSWRVVLFLTF